MIDEPAGGRQPAASSKAGQWRLAPEAELALRIFDDGFVVHHALTNATHCLTGPAGELLLCLRDAGPQGAAELASPYDASPDEVESLLVQLATLELVQRC
jgi:hypothetical protein